MPNFNKTLLSPFNPNQFPGLQFWHDASNPNKNGIQPSNNTSISNFRDLGLLGNDALQATGANQPTFLTNQQNGLPGISFNGSSNYLAMTNGFANVTNNMTYFAVASFPNIQQTSGILNDSVLSGSNRISMAFPYFNSGVQKYFFDFGNISTGGRLTNTWTQSFNTFYVFAFEVNSAASTMTIYVNGSVLYTQNTVSTFNPTGLSAYIGNFISNFDQMILCEHIFYNKALTAEQMLIATEYLRNKWGIINPSDISGLVSWYDVNDPQGNGSQPANNTLINSLTDKSSSGNTLGQGITVDQPTFFTNIANGKPGLLFNGSTTYLIGTSTNLPTGSSARTCFLAVKWSSVATQQYILQWGNQVSTGNLWAIGNYDNGTGTQKPHIDTDTNFVVGNSAISSSGVSILQINYSGSGNLNTTSMTLNGITQTLSGGTSGFSTSSGTNLIMGKRIDNICFFNGYFLESLVYAGSLNAYQTSQIINYLTNKWG